MSRERLIAVGSSLASLVLGGVIGYYAAKRHLTAIYEGEIAREIEVAKYLAEERWKNRNYVPLGETPQWTEEGYPDPRTAHAEALDALAVYAGGDPDEEDPPFEPEPKRMPVRGPNGRFVKNAAEQAKADLDLAKRSTDEPIIISSEEYFQNEQDWTQSSLTYYAGDDVLADERDQAISDVDRIVGCDNLTQFGTLSGDDNVVYVRNSTMHHEFEITLSTGSYKAEVLGLDDTPRGLQRRRSGDDG